MRTSLEKRGTKLTVGGTIYWGIIGISLTWKRGYGLLSIQLDERSLWKQAITRGLPEPTILSPGDVHGRNWEQLRPLLPVAMRGMGLLRHHLRVRSFFCDMILGFPSASTTGLTYGYFQVAKGVLTPFSRVTLRMTPDFDRTICDGLISLSIEVRNPLILVFQLIRLGLQQPVRGMLVSRRGL
ncbi:MAG: DUF2953 domain-containing protein [Methanomicrobiales archaeon]|nr:DUF2953 domain-containing protein [Methanomicrobiales archaeon]